MFTESIKMFYFIISAAKSKTSEYEKKGEVFLLIY